MILGFHPFCQDTSWALENGMNSTSQEAKVILILQTNFPMITKQLKVLIFSYIPLLLLGCRLYLLHILTVSKPPLGFW